MKRTIVPLGLAAVVLVALFRSSPSPERSRRLPVSPPPMPRVEAPPEALTPREVKTVDEATARAPLSAAPESADGLAVWLLELSDEQLASLVGTPEMHRYVARVLSALEARSPQGRSPEIPDFLDRLNARIRSIRQG